MLNGGIARAIVSSLGLFSFFWEEREKGFRRERARKRPRVRGIRRSQGGLPAVSICYPSFRQWPCFVCRAVRPATGVLCVGLRVFIIVVFFFNLLFSQECFLCCVVYCCMIFSYDSSCSQHLFVDLILYRRVAFVVVGFCACVGAG